MSLGIIPQDVIDQIKDRTDILDVVSGYVTLSKAGQNFKGKTKEGIGIGSSKADVVRAFGVPDRTAPNTDS